MEWEYTIGETHLGTGVRYLAKVKPAQGDQRALERCRSFSSREKAEIWARETTEKLNGGSHEAW